MAKKQTDVLDDIINGKYANKVDSLSKRVRDLQVYETDKLAKSYPNVPIMEILNNANADKTFRNSKLSQRADSLNNLYGSISIPASKDFINSINEYNNILNEAGINANVVGSNEDELKSFGWRSLLQKQLHDKNVPAYKYLENNNDMDNEYKKGGWIQKATASIKRRGTEGVCTGAKFGSSSCPAGSKRYNLAKTFKKMARNRADGGYIDLVPNRELNFYDGGNLYFLGGLTGATAMEGSAEVGGQLSGMINPNTKGGGAASGALKGASMGAALGPYGMAAGAVLGGTVGLINAQNQQNREAFAETNNAIRNRNQMLGIKAKGGRILIPMGVSPNMATEYKDGGELTEFNNGGSHESNPYQGIPQGVSPDGEVNKVEQGETKWNDYIFSDRLLLDKGTVEEHNLPSGVEGKSFAEASKKLSKLFKERPNDVISKNTAKDYMQRLTMANDKVREIDEANNVMAYGGSLYKGGGRTNPIVQIDDPMYYEGQMKLAPTLQPSANIQNKLQLENKLTSRVKDNSKALSDNRTNLGFLRDPKNLRYAPIAFDALASTGLFGKTPTPKEFAPSLIQQQGYLTPDQIDEMQMQNAVNSAYQTGASALGEAAGGSGAALRAGLSGLNKDYMSSIGKAYSDANQANIAQKQAAQQYNLSTQGNIASQNAQLLNQAGMYNNQLLNNKLASDYDTRMSYLGKAAEGLGDIGYEARTSEIMPRIFGYDQYGNYIAPLKEKATAKSCGGKLKMRNRKK